MPPAPAPAKSRRRRLHAPTAPCIASAGGRRMSRKFSLRRAMNPADSIPEPAAIVGISACVRDVNGFPFHAVNQRYLIALTEASGVVPLIVPALGERVDLDRMAERLDGLLVTGSPSNIEPFHYGAEPAAPDILHDAARDATTDRKSTRVKSSH